MSRHVRAGAQVLDEGWQLCATAPGQCASPADLPPDAGWVDAPVAGPVAAVLRARGEWSLDAPARRFDAHDWWYRVRFDADPATTSASAMLGFDGLATLAEVWLNGQPILSSSNMFVAHTCEVSDGLRAEGNELVVVFRSLDQALTKRRPRPRWRAPMIENQQLRWFRTTVLGRTPGWTPPAAVVGPWRDVWLASRPELAVADLALHPRVDGAHGRLSVSCRLQAAPGVEVSRVEFHAGRAGLSWHQSLNLNGDGRWQGEIAIDNVALWWPHTHGEPALHEACLQVWLKGRTEPLSLPVGEVGFRTVEIDQQDGGFVVKVNGVRVFCRGACWTPLDVVTLDAPRDTDYRLAIAQLREAGMNMVRLGGTMTYEADAFYDECDRQGIMVWQELMFANMDYPEDADFIASVQAEVRQQLGRWQGRPAITVLCGNSEVEQQAAMFGATRDRWAPALFHEVLAEVCRQGRPDVPYWPSSAHGGAFPHQGDVGTTSYYGVGAYMRPLDDARRSNVKFATECLAFANVPEASGIARMPGGLALKVHHAAWKARTPRDLGAGWDFEDVRDHYLAQLFDVDPARLRYSDHDRYLALGRVAVGEVMTSAFADWRRAASSCGGALIWFLRDLWPGAGWGVIDSGGLPKSAYYYLKRALQPVSVSLTDEGGNGYYLHANNEGHAPLEAEIEITALRHGHTQVGQGRQVVTLPPHGASSWPLLAWFDWFADWSWAYRFGPPSAHVMVAVLRSMDGRELARSFAFPTGHVFPVERDLGMRAHARLVEPGVFDVTLSTDRFAQAVHFDIDHLVPDDAYFHLAPGESKVVRMRTMPGTAAPSGVTGSVRALNLDGAVTIQMESERT